ncbi:MAG: HAMP domain-containing histidine kinase [Opitutales bacterium]|nr:HAMP domain-containing histidine kinase [Opitutales bacterium]
MVQGRVYSWVHPDAWQLSVKGKPTQFGGLIRELVEDYEMQSSSIRFSITADGDVSAVADRSFLTQILQNLLGNASKYNDDELPWVEVTCEAVDKEIRINISNGGDGIPEAGQARLFDRFTRVDSA